MSESRPPSRFVPLTFVDSKLPIRVAVEQIEYVIGAMPEGKSKAKGSLVFIANRDPIHVAETVEQVEILATLIETEHRRWWHNEEREIEVALDPEDEVDTGDDESSVP